MNSYTNSLLSGLNYGMPQQSLPNNFQAIQNSFQPMLNASSGNDQLVGVNGFESAKAYPTKPNGTYVLFDTGKDVFYVKNTDASNFPTIKAYSFKEIKPEEAQTEEKYVTVEEFRKFKKEILNGKQFVRKPARSADGSANSKWGNRKYSADKESYAVGPEQWESAGDAPVSDSDKPTNE